MSVRYDKMRLVRIYPELFNRMKALRASMPFPVSTTAIANRCMERGLDTLEKPPIIVRKLRKNHEPKIT